MPCHQRSHMSFKINPTFIKSDENLLHIALQAVKRTATAFIQISFSTMKDHDRSEETTERQKKIYFTKC